MGIFYMEQEKICICGSKRQKNLKSLKSPNTEFGLKNQYLSIDREFYIRKSILLCKKNEIRLQSQKTEFDVQNQCDRDQYIHGSIILHGVRKNILSRDEKAKISPKTEFGAQGRVSYTSIGNLLKMKKIYALKRELYNLRFSLRFSLGFLFFTAFSVFFCIKLLKKVLKNR
jgi:hypothetical protein